MDKAKILVIDDDAGVVSVLRSILADEGFEVWTANSAHCGLTILLEKSPDLIILDLKMPGMSGVGFLNEISGSDGKPKYPVLVLTAHGSMSGFFKNIDIDGFMLKPVRGEDLVLEVNRILAARNSLKKPRPDAPDVVMSRKKAVLIAEDDDKTSNILALAFSQAGYATEQTNNGNDAVGKAILSVPDVVVLKAVLSSMNGNKVASVLKTVPKTCHIPVVLYDQDGFASTSKDALMRSGDITSFVPNNSPKDILDAVAHVLRDR